MLLHVFLQCRFRKADVIAELAGKLIGAGVGILVLYPVGQVIKSFPTILAFERLDVGVRDGMLFQMRFFGESFIAVQALIGTSRRHRRRHDTFRRLF